MALAPEEIQELKAQLKGQIAHLPSEKKAEAERQIDSMSEEAIETMLAQQQTQGQKIFRMLVEKQIPSVMIEENNDAIVVLSTKAISRGHVLIIPKAPVKDEKEFPSSVHKLSEEISKKLINGLKAKSTTVVSEKAFGEVVLNIIPIYDKPLNLQSPRKESSLDELEKVKTEINVEKIEKKVEKIKLEKKSQDEILKLRRRVP